MAPLQMFENMSAIFHIVEFEDRNNSFMIRTACLCRYT
jgi:hypothetical protein